jgi:hypothetical protein
MHQGGLSGSRTVVKSRFLLEDAGDGRFLATDHRVLVDKHNSGRHHSMPTKDSFTPDQNRPLFLSEDADEPEQPEIYIAGDVAVIWSRILKATALLVAASAIAIVILSLENPITSFATIKASLFDMLPLQPGNEQPTSTGQTIAITDDVPPTAAKDDAPANPETAPPVVDKAVLPSLISPSATEAPARNQTAEAVVQNQTEISQPSADALFNQYVAWRAERSHVQSVQNARPRAQPITKQRQARLDRNARAEVRSVPIPQRNVRREAQVQDPRAQNAPAQDDPSGQDSQVPSSFLQIFGKRN